jgi:hypothetical protein
MVHIYHNAHFPSGQGGPKGSVAVPESDVIPVFPAFQTAGL